jgi:outer membrane protein assembly factor BamB
MNGPRNRRLLATIVLVLLCAQAAQASDWPGWRGPTGLGYCDEKDLPLTWNGKTGENIVWKALLHGGAKRDQEMTQPGWSCPIVWKDRVFITTCIFPDGLTHKERLPLIAEHHVLCFDAKDGKQLWDTVIPPGKIVTLVTNVYHGYAVSTPVTDGKNVFALFCSGVLVSLDYEGKIAWREELPRLKDAEQGICSSPILFEDSVIVPGLHDMGLRALYKKDGKVKWEQQTKFRNTMATPALIRIQDKLQLIHYAGGMQGLDPATGDLLWTCKAPSSQSSPVFGNGLLYADHGRGGDKGAAIDPVGKGDLSKTNVKWENRVKGVAGSSAIFVDGYIYRSSGDSLIRCWSMKDGEPVDEIKAPKITPSASPIATADGRIYWANPGRSYVIKANPKLEILAANDLDDGHDFTTAAISNGRIYIKGRAYLWCIGKK